MDPVSLTASIIAIAELTGSLIGYLKDLKDCPNDSKLLLQEASNLSNLLTRLNCRVEETQSTDPWFQQIRLLDTEGGVLDQFRTNLEGLVGKTEARTGRHRLKQTVLWKFTKSEIIEALNRIERLKSLLTSALVDDHFTLSKAIQAEVSGIKEKINRIESYHDSAEFRNFSSWLNPPDPSINYHAALKKRQEGTGLWLISKPEFVEWKRCVGKPMWLHGKPGCGKTVLSASILSDPELHFESEVRKPLGFFYCDFGDSTKQTLQSLTRSLLLQLASQITGGHQLVQQLYEKCHNGQLQPSDDATESCLHRVIASSGDAYIVIDALDECCERDALLTFLEELVNHCSDHLHLLMTSRQEHDIKEQLLHIVSFQINLQSKLVDSDIKLYVQERLSKDPKLNRWSESIKEEIMSNLISKADGMFRWVFCQLDALKKCVTPRNIRKILTSLPRTLDKTYERIWDQIEEDDHLEDAILILQFLCYFKRPLRLVDIVEILAVGIDGNFSCEERLPNPEEIQLICSTFINLTPIKDYGHWEKRKVLGVGLGHYSVQEYLLSDRNRHFAHFTPESGHASLARVSLVYLIDACEQTEPMYLLRRDRPFLYYSAMNWWNHLAIIQNEMPLYLFQLTNTLLEERLLMRWTQQYQIETRDGQTSWNESYQLGPAIYYASFAGLLTVVDKLLEQGSDPNNCDGSFGTALHVASVMDYRDIVQMLLDRGADINARGGRYNGTALQAASAHGIQNIVQLLLDRGADVNIEGGEDYGTALHAAASEGYQDIVQMLLDRGANPDIQGGKFGNALQAACVQRSRAIIEMLLDHGADVNIQSVDCGTAIQIASNSGKEEIVQLLLKRGANIHIQVGCYWTTLQAACVSSYSHVVQILLDHGADVNVQGGANGTALQAACAIGCEETVQMLLDHGADVNIQGGERNTALQAASSVGAQDIVQILLNRGADVNVQGGRYGTALQAASLSGNTELVQLLLDHGADIHIQGGEYWTALQAASSSGNKETVKLLLNYGADVNIEGGEHGSALAVASLYFFPEIVQILLNHGADVNIQDGAPLRSAFVNAKRTIVRMLLDHGANPDGYEGELASGDPVITECDSDGDDEPASDEERAQESGEGSEQWSE